MRFLTLGEAIGEDPNTTEEAFGGMLAPDEFVGADGSSDIVEARRRERRRLAAVALYRLCAHESTTSRIFSPSAVYFLCSVLQENHLAQMQGRGGLPQAKDERELFHLSSQAAMKALDKIARHPELQPSARRDVAGALMQLDALEDVISLVERPCDVNRGTKSGAFDYPHDLETSLAAVTLLASVLPKMNGVDAIPDEEQLEVEAVRAVRNSVVDGKVLLRLAHQESHRLIRILLLSGEVVDGGNFRYPRLLTETCFTLARIASTTRTAHAVFRAGAVRALAIVIPSAPRLPAEYRQPRFEGNDYRPEGAEIAGISSADTKTLRSMPAAMMTLLAALARSREAVNDQCAHGFLERAIERFFSTTSDPEQDMKMWGKLRSSFRLASGGKNVKGYGSCNEVLVRSGVIARLMSMMAPHNRQHRRIRLHAMVALVAMMHDSIMTIPIVMRDNVALKMCLKVAVNMHDTEAIRRQALLIIRSAVQATQEASIILRLKKLAS